MRKNLTATRYKRIGRLLLLSAGVCLMGGCFTLGPDLGARGDAFARNAPPESEAAKSIRRGMTMAEVRSALGNPAFRSSTNGRDAWTYRQAVTNPAVYPAQLMGPLAIPYLIALKKSGGLSESRTLVVIFNSSGRVQDVQSSSVSM